VLARLIRVNRPSDPSRPARQRRLRAPRRARAGIAGLLAAAAGASSLLAFSLPASAAPQNVTGGGLSWGTKASFVSYVTGPIAQGSITPSGGASQANGAFAFPNASGSADPAPASVDARFDGAIRFLGHGGLLDLTFSDLHLATNGPTGSLQLDYTGTSLSGGASISGADVTVATLSDVTYPSVAADGIDVSAATVTLTADGAAAFAGFYAAGTALDPLSATIDLQAPVAVTTTSLIATPPSPQVAGSGVTLTATVSPASAAGSVEFLDGGTSVGSATLDGSGVAALHTTALAPGDHSLTASFAPADAGAFAPSTSDAAAYTISPARRSRRRRRSGRSRPARRRACRATLPRPIRSPWAPR
jgi:hypothetical protein